MTLIVCLLVVGCDKPPEKDAFDLSSALGGVAESGFARADRPRNFVFPEDHYAHPEFRNEWWYITGNLHSENGRQFGYQVTFFRIALAPEAPDIMSDWASNQVWMVHIAVTDVQNKRHYHDERFARGAAGLAGQQKQPFKVWLEDWQLLGDSEAGFPWTITTKSKEFALNLHINPLKSVVLQGDDGLSQKSNAVGNASYYYSLTRLATNGEVVINDEGFEVEGLSWLDREWSTSVLGDDQEGWDWFSLQLADGNDLMFYRMRNKNGTADPLSGGKWVFADGTTKPLGLQEVELKPQRYWSAEDGRSYPVAWTMKIPELNRDWKVVTLVDDQLMETGITYWEGTVQVLDSRSDELLGTGYLEMSGY